VVFVRVMLLGVSSLRSVSFRVISWVVFWVGAEPVVALTLTV